MIRRPPRSTLDRSSAASDVYKRQADDTPLWDVRFRRECRIGDVGRADSEVPIRIETYGHEGRCIRRARGTSVAALAERAGAHRQNAQRKDPGGDFLHSHAVYL